MANSKNTKKDRDEKKSGDLSALNDSFSSYDSETDSPNPEFTSKYSAYDENDSKDYSTSAYASKINKSYGSETSKSKNSNDQDDDDSYTSQLGNDQRSPDKREQYRTTGSQQYRGKVNQLSYDQQGHYQPPVQQEYNQQRAFDQPYGNPGYGNQSYRNQNQNFGAPGYQQGQGYQNQVFNNPSFGYQNQPFGYNQQQGYPAQFHPQYQQRQFQQPGFGAQQQFNQPYQSQGFQQPQGFNQSSNYGNQYGNQQFVNRGYENHNYNDQNNGLRSSFNTQGFGDSVYRHENFHPENGGSGYAGSTFGGQGSGEYRGQEYGDQQQFGAPHFTSHREFRNPSRGFNRDYRRDEAERNNYQRDEDGYTRGFEGSFNSPYGEEQFGYERDFSRPFPEDRNFESQNYRSDFERRNREQNNRSNRKARNRRHF
jgi:hypothetical protein